MAATAHPTCAGCSHEPEAHAHCRPGTDCALCDCPRYRTPRSAVLAAVWTALRSTVRPEAA